MFILKISMNYIYSLIMEACLNNLTEDMIHTFIKSNPGTPNVTDAATSPSIAMYIVYYLLRYQSFPPKGRFLLQENSCSTIGKEDVHDNFRLC